MLAEVTTGMLTSPISCTVRVGPYMAHTEEILAGFVELAQRGHIELRIERAPAARARRQHVMEARVRGRRLAYDMHDGYMTNPDGTLDLAGFDNELAAFDDYYKRSCDGVVNSRLTNGARIHPLGLAYLASADARVMPWAMRAFDPKRFVKWLVRRDPPIRAFERPPVEGDGSVLFMTRVWDPEEATCSREADVRRQMNEARAACVRVARSAFGRRFVGGLAADDFTRRTFPDCVLPDPRTASRRRFMALVARASVCVATTGLHRSIGWKMAEYVAASRAIVSEPLHYELPGDFRTGEHYLEFVSGDDLVAAADRLLSDASLRERQMRANWEYYRNWVRPDALVLNTLRPFMEATGGAPECR